MVTTAQLARRYGEYLAVLHAALGRGRRGAAPVVPFMAWVEDCWRDDAPPEPAGPPAAVSAGGWGTVRWHEAGRAIRGYVPGLAGCYEVPVTPPCRRSGTRRGPAGGRNAAAPDQKDSRARLQPQWRQVQPSPGSRMTEGWPPRARHRSVHSRRPRWVLQKTSSQGSPSAPHR